MQHGQGHQHTGRVGENGHQQQARPAGFPAPGNYMFANVSTQLELGHPMAGPAYPNANPYLVGLVANYVAQATVSPHMFGVPQAAEARMAIPSAGSFDQVREEILVSETQYKRILRRREIRAREEAENRHVKERKPYLHESRHKHALSRPRGSGGRFLNTKANEEDGAATADSEGGPRTLEGQLDFHASQSRQEVLMDSIHGLQGLSSTAYTAVPTLQQMQYHPRLMSQGPIGMVSVGNPGGGHYSHPQASNSSAFLAFTGGADTSDVTDDQGGTMVSNNPQHDEAT